MTPHSSVKSRFCRASGVSNGLRPTGGGRTLPLRGEMMPVTFTVASAEGPDWARHRSQKVESRAANGGVGLAHAFAGIRSRSRRPAHRTGRGSRTLRPPASS